VSTGDIPEISFARAQLISKDADKIGLARWTGQKAAQVVVRGKTSTCTGLRTEAG